ncbi:MAG: DUF58 domain-containing protein [Planctomycetaceae bacterium]|nr:DUF58 domain-containing protein [Planctomycetaceae bacterium]
MAEPPVSREQSDRRRLPGAVTPELLSRLSGLGVKARAIVEGFVTGLHRSPHHGFSIEFAEHREYSPGDDLKYVDWKVFAKSDRYYLKQFEEETNFACHVLLDVSDSMRYRSERASMTKLEYGTDLAAALGYLILRQQDGVGLTTFDELIRDRLPPASQPSHLDPYLALLERQQPSRELSVEDVATAAPSVDRPHAGEEGLAGVLRDVALHTRRRGLVVLFSDLFENPEQVLRGLKHLRHQKHDVIVVQVIDRAEREFPFDEPTQFFGLEGTGERRLEPRGIREAYCREFETALRTLQRGVRNLGMDCLLVMTDEPLDVSLSRILKRQPTTARERPARR